MQGLAAKRWSLNKSLFTILIWTNKNFKTLLFVLLLQAFSTNVSNSVDVKDSSNFLNAFWNSTWFSKARVAVTMQFLRYSVAFKSPETVRSFISRYWINKADCSCVATVRFMYVHSNILRATAELSNHLAACHAISKPELLRMHQLF